jgi:hypothetical protein
MKVIHERSFNMIDRTQYGESLKLLSFEGGFQTYLFYSIRESGYSADQKTMGVMEIIYNDGNFLVLEHQTPARP